MKQIVISILHQSLELIDGSHSKIYTVSTSKLGPGEHKDSFRTPRGKHIIRAKIGGGEPNGMIFKGRRPTGEIYQKELSSDSEDWILTRILWLSGKELEGIDLEMSTQCKDIFIFMACQITLNWDHPDPWDASICLIPISLIYLIKFKSERKLISVDIACLGQSSSQFQIQSYQKKIEKCSSIP